jgi:hypothetical protein
MPSCGSTSLFDRQFIHSSSRERKKKGWPASDFTWHHVRSITAAHSDTRYISIGMMMMGLMQRLVLLSLQCVLVLLFLLFLLLLLLLLLIN